MKGVGLIKGVDLTYAGFVVTTWCSLSSRDCVHTKHSLHPGGVSLNA